MATYCYTNDEHLTVEKHFPVGTAPKTVEIGGVVFHRDIAAEHCGYQNVLPKNYPYYSASMGILPKQWNEFKALADKKGVPLERDARGRVKVESPRHRKQLMRFRQVRDFDGYD